MTSNRAVANPGKLLAIYGAMVFLALTALANYLGGCADRSSLPTMLSNSSTVAPTAVPGVDVIVADPRRGRALFAAHCAPCHGAEGRGNGEFASMLNPPARDFARGSFKITSTASGLPSDADLLKTLRRGMFPSLMPPRQNWPEEDLRALIPVIRGLAIEGHVADQLAENPTRSRDEANRRAHAALGPGPAISLPPRPATLDLARGKAFYLGNCAICHDPDGSGSTRTDLVDNDDRPIAPRDFTQGFFKGGSSIDEIAVRIYRGMPGTPMPGHPDIKAEDLWSTAAYVRTFIPPASQMPELPPCPTSHGR